MTWAQFIAWLQSRFATKPPTLPPRPTGAPVFDDFNGPAGSAPDPKLWNIIAAATTSLWADGEVGDYTADPANVRLDGQSRLVIEAHRKTVAPVPPATGTWTTGYVSTGFSGPLKLGMLYGRLEARIKPPIAKGVWPVFCLFGANFPQVGWPKCGELDMMELAGAEVPNHITLHDSGNYMQGAKGGAPVAGDGVPPGVDLSADFHTYWVERRKDAMWVGVDNYLLATYTPATFKGVWIFNAPAVISMQVQVAGDWPGPPDVTTPSPSTMLVDWVRWTPV